MSGRRDDALSPRPTLGYRPELDGLRAVAVLTVIAYHYRPRTHPLLSGGFLGVDLFFVLSGFLITRLLFEELQRTDGVRFRSFYARRAARLLPALVLVCVFVGSAALFSDALGPPGHAFLGILGSIFYVNNWLLVLGHNSPLRHTWSLSIEEQFYLVWPALMLLAWRRAGLRSVRVVAGTIAVVSGVEMAIRSALGVSAVVLYHSTDTQGALMLMTGCLLATLVPVGSDLRSTPIGRAARAATAPISIALVFLATSTSQASDFYYRGIFCFVAAGFAVIILRALMEDRLTAPLRARPLVWIGKISYGLYLWHYPIWLFVSTEFAHQPFAVVATASLASSFAAATVSYYWVEQPIRQVVTARFGRTSNAAPAP